MFSNTLLAHTEPQLNKLLPISGSSHVLLYHLPGKFFLVPFYLLSFQVIAYLSFRKDLHLDPVILCLHGLVIIVIAPVLCDSCL